MDEYKLLSPEKIHLKIQLAGIGSRFAALAIDMMIQIVLCGAILIGTAFFADKIEWEHISLSEGISLAVVIVALFLIFAGYFIFFETIWNGQTPGKRLVKLRTVQTNGSTITFLMALIRNSLRIVDWLPSGYVIGIVTMLITKRNQRLGDMLAGTMVIHEQQAAVPEQIQFHVHQTAWSDTARLHIHNISEADFAVLKNYFLRSKTLGREEADMLEQKLVIAFSQKLGLTPAVIEDRLEFLQQVMAMYQQRG